jgi:hypothetical protein
LSLCAWGQKQAEKPYDLRGLAVGGVPLKLRYLSQKTISSALLAPKLVSVLGTLRIGFHLGIQP